MQKTKTMTKKLLITLFIIALFASCGTRSGNNVCTCTDGVMIDGVCWATRNVDMPGTFAENPESLGMLFEWNRRSGWNAVDRYVEGWGMGYYYPIPIGTKWYAENDPCPTGWRVPTREELLALENAKNSERVRRNGAYGRLFGIYPHQIFLPTAGYRSHSNGALNFAGIGGSGYYWSSTAYRESRAWSLSFFWDKSEVFSSLRSRGKSIRCVAK